MKNNYKRTIRACCMGYIAQAAVNNFIPLLFVFFNDFFDIPLSKITLLITVNFAVQLIVDLLSAGFADKIGYKKTMTLANALCALGMICLVVLPYVTDEYAGILISVVIYAVGAVCGHCRTEKILRKTKMKNNAP